MDHGVDFSGRTVVVTGAASGVGQATAILIRDLGGTVIALDWKPVDLTGVRHVAVDIGDRHSIEQAAQAIAGERLDALCNIAAVSSGSGHDPSRIMAINFIGTRHLTELLIPSMRHGSAIVCVSSGAARAWRDRHEVGALVRTEGFDAATEWFRANPDDAAAYGLSKEAINRWTKVMVPRLRAPGIRINTVAPGLVDTLMPRQSTQGSFEQLVAGVTAHVDRIGQPMDIAWPIAFLASPASAYVNGQVIEVDGGLATALGVQGVA